MRRLVTLSAVALVLAVGCSGASDETTADSTDGASSTAPVDLAPIADEPPASTTPLNTPPPATQPSTTTTSTTPKATTTPPSSTSRPATTPPATTPPSSISRPTTTPPTTQPTKSEGSTALKPAFIAFGVSNVSPCPAPDASATQGPRDVVVSWEVIGTESVYVAIDNVDGPFATGLPPAGSITLPNNCPDGNTYFVVAENPDGRTVQQATR